MNEILMILAMLALGELSEEPSQLPACEPPPKRTVTVLCAPDEGCEQRWIFVEPEVPLS